MKKNGILACMRNWFEPRTLRMRILSLIVMSALLPTFIAIEFLFHPIADVVTDEYITMLDSSMGEIARVCDNQMSQLKSLSTGLYGNSSYIAMLKHGMNYQNSTIYNDMLTALNLTFVNHPFIDELRFYFTRDRNLWRVNRRNRVSMSRYFEQDELESIFYETKAMYHLVPLQTVEEYDDTKPVFTSLQFITDFPWDDVIGVFAADISASALNEIFEDINLYEGETICLLTEGGELLYLKSSGYVEAGLFRAMIKAVSFGDRGVVLHRVERAEYLTSVRKLKNSEVYLLRYVPMESLTSRANGILRHTLVLFSIMAAVSLVLGVSLSNHAVKPLQVLEEHMQRVENGSLGEQMEETFADEEFVVLARCFNKMSKEIEKLVSETYELQLTKRTAELKALQAQINPHFIFNTLQSVHYLALEHNAYEINIVVDSLSDILHYCLRGEADNVPLREEVQAARQYLTIQQVRFIEQLRVFVDIKPETMDRLIPKMTIQPLLENAILHGMKSSEECTVRLSAFMDGENLILEVEDNGAGIEKEKLEEIRKSLNFGAPAVKDGYHIGIRNCWLRLNYLYPHAVEFRIDSKPSYGTCVQIRILAGKGEASHEVPNCG